MCTHTFYIHGVYTHFTHGYIVYLKRNYTWIHSPYTPARVHMHIKYKNTYKICIYANTSRPGQIMVRQCDTQYGTLAFQPLYICIRIQIKSWYVSVIRHTGIPTAVHMHTHTYVRIYSECMYENTSRPGQIMVLYTRIPTALEVRVFHELFFVLQVGKLYICIRIRMYVYMRNAVAECGRNSSSSCRWSTYTYTCTEYGVYI